MKLSKAQVEKKKNTKSDKHVSKQELRNGMWIMVNSTPKDRKKIEDIGVTFNKYPVDNDIPRKYEIINTVYGVDRATSGYTDAYPSLPVITRKGKHFYLV